MVDKVTPAAPEGGQQERVPDAPTTGEDTARVEAGVATSQREAAKKDVSQEVEGAVADKEADAALADVPDAGEQTPPTPPAEGETPKEEEGWGASIAGALSTGLTSVSGIAGDLWEGLKSFGTTIKDAFLGFLRSLGLSEYIPGLAEAGDGSETPAEGDVLPTVLDKARFTGEPERVRNHIQNWAESSGTLKPIFAETAKRHPGVPTELAVAFMMQESGGDVDIHETDKDPQDVGPAQVTESAWDAYVKANPNYKTELGVTEADGRTNPKAAVDFVFWRIENDRKALGIQYSDPDAYVKLYAVYNRGKAGFDRKMAADPNFLNNEIYQSVGRFAQLLKENKPAPRPAQPESAEVASLVALDKLPFGVKGQVSPQITSGFGVYRGDHNHQGVDIAGMPKGTPIHSKTQAVVERVGYKPESNGNYVYLKYPDGKIYCLLHLEEQPNLTVGSTVNPGDLIGKVGNTGHVIAGAGGDGTHLHVQVYNVGELEKGKEVDPSPMVAGLPGAEHPAV